MMAMKICNSPHTSTLNYFVLALVLDLPLHYSVRSPNIFCPSLWMDRIQHVMKNFYEKNPGGGAKIFHDENHPDKN